MCCCAKQDLKSNNCMESTVRHIDPPNMDSRTSVDISCFATRLMSVWYYANNYMERSN